MKYYNFYGRELKSDRPQPTLRRPYFGKLNDDGAYTNEVDYDSVYAPAFTDGFDETYTGFNGTFKMDVTELIQPGYSICRFGREFGYFTTDLGTPYEALSLPDNIEDREYHVYCFTEGFLDILKAEGIIIEKGRIAPAWECPGGGIQYVFRDEDEFVSMHDLVAMGVLVEDYGWLNNIVKLSDIGGLYDT